MRNQGKLIGILAAAGSAFFLGLTPIFGKIALQFGFSPLFIVTFRSILATILVFLFLLIIDRSYLQIYSLGLFGCAIAGFINGIGSILFYSALSFLDASIGQLLYSFYPLMVAFWLLLDRQPITKLTILRLFISIMGAVLLISASTQKVSIQGAVMMIGAAALYGLHLIINQKVLYEAPTPTVTFYTLLSMSATVSLAYMVFDLNIPPVSPILWPVTMLGIITAVSRVTLFLGIKNLGGMQTALLGLGELLVTVLTAQIFLNEMLSPLQWVGAILLLVSLILVGFDKLPPQKRRIKGMLSWLSPPEVNPTELP
jgi:drug/metabolite transporter (DMT)-like permease